MTRKEEILKALEESDDDAVRVIEDLVNVLVSRGHIRMSDFNDYTRNKLELRASLREELRSL